MIVQASPVSARLDAARRLGPGPVLWLLWHRVRVAGGAAGRALGEAAVPTGPFLAPGDPPPPPPPLPPGAAGSVLAAARALPSPVEHGPFDPAAPALGLDLFSPGDVRPVWEANRLGWAPLLALATRLEPRGGHLAALEGRLAAWSAANPPWRGPNWACGQEAALRGLHLALALALLGREAGPGGRALLALHARRVSATRAYARAQDNNHAVSEPAGLLALAWALGDGPAARRAARDLARAVSRLVAPDGGFAQVSTGYHRLLLDTLSPVEWLRRHHGATPLPDPLPARAAAATRWLARLACPETGATPRLGHQDGSALADLALAGPGDARASVSRAAALFGAGPTGWADDPGLAWLGLSTEPGAPPEEASWVASGSRGWRAGRASALLRTGPLRFRPGQSDLLHLDLRVGSLDLLRDGGTGAYNPPEGLGWWPAHLASAAAHNLIVFDGEEPMERAGRFLLARWPATRLLPDGAETRDRRGRVHARRVRPGERVWRVEDAVSGPFRALALRWRLAPGAWTLRSDGAEGAAARLALEADGPLDLAFEAGWESPEYGVVRPVPVLVARALAPVSRILTRVLLCDAAGDCGAGPGSR